MVTLRRGPKGQNRKAVGWRIRPEILERLEAECARRGLVPAQVVEEALEAMLAIGGMDGQSKLARTT